MGSGPARRAGVPPGEVMSRAPTPGARSKIGATVQKETGRNVEAAAERSNAGIRQARAARGAGRRDCRAARGRAPARSRAPPRSPGAACTDWLPRDADGKRPGGEITSSHPRSSEFAPLSARFCWFLRAAAVSACVPARPRRALTPRSAEAFRAREREAGGGVPRREARLICSWSHTVAIWGLVRPLARVIRVRLVESRWLSSSQKKRVPVVFESLCWKLLVLKSASADGSGRLFGKAAQGKAGAVVRCSHRLRERSPKPAAARGAIRRSSRLCGLWRATR